MESTLHHAIKRVNPRRPFTVTAEGLRRIVLGLSSTGLKGEIGDVVDVSLIASGQAHHQAKPLRSTQLATKSFLAVAHSDRGALDEHARQVIAAAALLADAVTEVVLLVFGEFNDGNDSNDDSNNASAILGVDRVIVLPQYGSHLFAPEQELAALRHLIDTLQPEHIFIPDCTLSGGDLGRRLGAALAQAGDSDDFNSGIATHVVEINSTGLATYRQQQSLMARRNLSRIIMLAPDAVDTRLPFLGRGELDEKRIATASAAAAVSAQESSRYRDHGIKVLAASQMALDEADFIVSAGNGVDDVATFNGLASVLEAAVGASRVAVDDGKFSRDQQIGATGKTVSASVYLAFGISGAVQHLQGIKDCRHVITVNLDASAPMIKRADLSIIDDAHAVITALLEQVKQARNVGVGNIALSNIKVRTGSAS
ncbi:electron transfer flavoprotein subunit alpha/FixB family protein [Glaciimonas sp. Gout2]|uniref:electron transfer flavoprotein subunit alpha/FixB family protein n=1 Tax=Glaciimonas sp. Gout2 TaxID=3048625 RepID=UPI002B224DE2|nr:electron transfer flavoprotein subunit alpha/FixB family protein [Glaciimonas sp. Gout2]MEB0081551.1 electron transfer flavoprotein subunit alpha/FixB family protein [Glaciimonas sp. Gout2]